MSSKSWVGKRQWAIYSLLYEHISTALQFFLLRMQSFIRCLVQTAYSAKTINFGAECLCVLAERLELDPNSLPLFARDFLNYRCGHRRLWRLALVRKTRRVGFQLERLKDGGGLDHLRYAKSSDVTITITCSVTMTCTVLRVNFMIAVAAVRGHTPH